VTVYLLMYHDSADYYVTDHDIIGAFSTRELAVGAAVKDRGGDKHRRTAKLPDEDDICPTYWYDITEIKVDHFGQESRV
jgi:hypothetical protein